MTTEFVRDPQVWVKTANEKKQLSRLRRLFKGKMHGGVDPKRPIPVEAKLIIHLTKNNKFPRTTVSVKCYQHQIGDILSYYMARNKKGEILNYVKSYYFNGRTYKPSERPFWGVRGV